MLAAFDIEKTYSKQQIFEMYANTIEGLGIKDVYLAAAVKTREYAHLKKNMDCRMRRYSIWAMIFPIMK